MTPVTPEDYRWEEAQPLIGSPSLSGVAAALEIAGLKPVELAFSDDGEFITFSLRRNGGRGPVASGREDLLRTVIQSFRRSGFRVGFSEVALEVIDREYLTGGTLTGPVVQVCSCGPISVEI